MGDHHQCGASTDQVLGQPGHRLDIEMVGGLVEDQQLIVVEQQSSQSTTPALATRQALDLAVE